MTFASRSVYMVMSLSSRPGLATFLRAFFTPSSEPSSSLRKAAISGETSPAGAAAEPVAVPVPVAAPVAAGLALSPGLALVAGLAEPLAAVAEPSPPQAASERARAAKQRLMLFIGGILTWWDCRARYVARISELPSLHRHLLGSVVARGLA